MRLLVEDAVEIADLTVGAYTEIRRMGWQIVGDEAISFYVTTLRMPSMVFERLADRLDEVDRALSRDEMPPSVLSRPRTRGLPVGGSFPERGIRGSAGASPKGEEPLLLDI
ncbi:hypothetical protein FMN50_03270 [Rhodobacterales bacterium]|nr:hypothetical protein FMN50_03270 [Rhodobacterales bacterium]